MSSGSLAKVIGHVDLVPYYNDGSNGTGDAKVRPHAKVVPMALAMPRWFQWHWRCQGEAATVSDGSNGTGDAKVRPQRYQTVPMALGMPR